MKYFIIILIISLSFSQQQARSISIQEAKQIVDTKSAIIVDARNPKDFESGHIQDAINQYARWRKLDDVFASIKKDQLILVYCSHNRCPYADRVAGLLQVTGYTNLTVFHGGVKEWKEAGYKLVTKKPAKKTSK